MKTCQFPAPKDTAKLMTGEKHTSGAWHISSSALLANQKRLVIEHNGDEYVLRITRNGKLILTK